MKNKIVGGLMVFLGLAVLGFWAIFIFTGNMPDGIYTVENNQYIIYHQLAEVVMACAAIISGVLLWKRHEIAPLVTMLAMGMLLYSAVNSSAHAMKNDLTLMPVFVFTFFVCVGGIISIGKTG